MVSEPTANSIDMASSSSMTQWNAIVALVSIKLDKDNYQMCYSQIEYTMISQDLLQFVYRSFPAPVERSDKDELNPEFTAWRKLDQLALSWIKSTVTQSVRNLG
uniref:Uncharacterized protein n=1 Tax=Nymphaea colorata TaxID=210225 RepID=A0A5K0YWI6_9MAGN|nr:unnamed protein product [Nymphaea colorata]